MTKFSVIITCYKQEQFIREAVDSALGLAYEDKEIIVVDDGSPDRSAQILKDYGARIRLIRHEENLGANAARNAGAAAASGEYLVFLDGDDCFFPWALDLYGRIIETKYPRIILGRLLFFQGAIPQREFWDFGEAVGIAEYEALIRKDHCYRGSASAIIIERKAFLSAGGFTPEIFPCEIEDLTAKLGCSGKTVHILSHPTTAYRVHDQNTVHQVGRFVEAMSALARKEKNGEYPRGSDYRVERYAYLGGPAAYWFVRGVRDGLYGPALRLLVRGWQFMLVAVCTRIAREVKGRSPTQWITMTSETPASVAEMPLGPLTGKARAVAAGETGAGARRGDGRREKVSTP
jgi:hypothetical protein